MANETLICPHCGKKIALSEALTRPIEERLAREREAELAAAKKEYEEKLVAELARRAKSTREEADKRAAETVAVELKDLREQACEKEKLLREAQEKEMELRKEKRQMEERERSLKLATERERESIRRQEAERAAGDFQLKEREYKDRLESMNKTIEDLKRKGEQGSQQAQGEAQEREIEDILRERFPSDEIEPVKAGARGADVLQRVVSPSGKPCGSILWESKRTKAWSDAWVKKLRDDQQEAKAEIAVIVSSALPEGIAAMGLYQGVWVADFKALCGMAELHRQGLITAARLLGAQAGRDEKMALLFKYFTGPEFRSRMEIMAVAMASMQDQIASEKRSMQRQWSAREKELERVMHNMAGMYGDLQGLAGRALPSIKPLELALDGEAGEREGGGEKDTGDGEGTEE